MPFHALLPVPVQVLVFTEVALHCLRNLARGIGQLGAIKRAALTLDTQDRHYTGLAHDISVLRWTEFTCGGRWCQVQMEVQLLRLQPRADVACIRARGATHVTTGFGCGRDRFTYIRLSGPDI